MFQKVGASALKKDLSNTLLLTNFLGTPQNKFKSVHIAGTNGKGSSAHTLSAILQSAGYKTGLYTSPHLKDFTERIKVNGKEIGEEQVVAFVEKIKPAIESVRPSFFEVTVGMAFDFFAREEVDIAIIETGLGGRLDSTNVIHPLLSLITNIGLDHQAILGETLAEIAAEKAGIIKQNIPVIIGEYQPIIASIFEEKAKSMLSPIYFAGRELKAVKIASENGADIFDIYWKDKLYLERVNVSLTGNYQVYNIPGILKSVQILNENGFTIPEGAVREGFRNVKTLTGLKGRWQILDTSPLTICDTGHNEAGIRYIVSQLRELEYNKLHMVIGTSNDKKLDDILKLLPKEAIYYFCQAQLPRALAADQLAHQAQEYGLHGKTIPAVNDAIKEARLNAHAGDVIFIGGSSFVVAEIEEL